MSKVKVYKMLVISRRIEDEKGNYVIPFDKTFEDRDGRQITCHATGYEVCWENPHKPENWWNEYISTEEDEYYYGR